MALDMYLRRKIYIGANYEHNEINGTINLYKKNEPIKIIFNKVTYVIEDCGYWGRANSIHNWMVENVQDGEDNCKEYQVEQEKLEQLLDICQKIKGNPTLAPELLPPTQGLFFCYTDYEDYYFENIDLTIQILTEILNDKIEYIDIEGNKKEYLRGDIYYQSSW